MSFHRLHILTVLILAFSVPSHAQSPESLGDVAREARAERQKQPGPRPKVITNDDIERPAAHRLRDSSHDAAADGAGETGQSATPSANPAEGVNKEATADAAEAKSAKSSAKASKPPVSEREARERETELRTQEINQRYTDRIAALRAQISAAQVELAKLQRGMMENVDEYRRTNAASPPDFKERNITFLTQIDAQRSLITSLNSQLEDAQESARHAGVPHATD
jgi:hypothetical protein